MILGSFCACIRKEEKEGKGGVVTSIPTIPSRVLYYPWHDYCVVLILALRIISFFFLFFIFVFGRYMF